MLMLFVGAGTHPAEGAVGHQHPYRGRAILTVNDTHTYCAALCGRGQVLPVTVIS